MIKSSELKLSSSGIVIEENWSGNDGEVKMEMPRNPELSRPCQARIESYGSDMTDNSRNANENEEQAQKFTMIFNKYNSKLNLGPSGKSHDTKSKDKSGSKYTMIFNKDVTIRSKLDPLQTSLKTDLKKGQETGKSEMNAGRTRVSHSQLTSMKLNDAETLMNLYGRSNLFIPDLICSATSRGNEDLKNKCNEKQAESAVNEKRKSNDPGLRLYNSLTSLSKNKGNKKTDTILKNKIASLTSLETHLAKEMPRKHVSVMQERKLFRVRSLDLSESVSSSDSDLERSFSFQKHGHDENQMGKESGSERSDRKSRGDAIRKGEKEKGCRKQVQWKSEVDVIYFESHLAADGDRSGEILGRVIEPLREEWEQQRTGFYAKLVPLQLGTHINERWQSLLKI